jgi:hypothetical protein
MRIATIIFVCLGLLLFCPSGISQTSSALTPEEQVEAGKLQHSLHPKLVMQDALARAEKFMVSENIDATHFWLYSARYTLFGSPTTPDKDKLVGWYFWWVSDAGEMGNYIEIFVSMDGQCRRLGSM